jgi:hypothetical protein
MQEQIPKPVLKPFSSRVVHFSGFSADLGHLPDSRKPFPLLINRFVMKKSAF